VRSIRGPFSFGNEGESRKRREFEIEAEAKSRDGFYVPIARIQKNSEFLSVLTSKKYRAQAIFHIWVSEVSSRRRAVRCEWRRRWNGAPRSMKMGTTRSPWRYDAAAGYAFQLAKLRRPSIQHFAT
jgi:hypothetical protein